LSLSGFAACPDLVLEERMIAFSGRSLIVGLLNEVIDQDPWNICW
jgi:hypothetical protein